MEQTKSLRIVIFDDDPAITRLLSLVLTNKGHDVITFQDPSYCQIYPDNQCECPQEFPCADVVISDIMMPNMNGIDLLRLQRDMGCKALPGNKALMSAKSDSIQKAAVEELGCHFIRKPFRLDDICNWVEQCAQRVPQDRKLAVLE
jgi:CheY-like chemotaxis protein